MDNKYERILFSRPFKFIIGPEKKEFIMHRAVVARLSKTLDKLLNGGMKESNDCCVVWEDTDEKTFVRFGEWAYTSDYQPEEPVILLDASLIATSEQDLAKKAKPELIAGRPLSPPGGNPYSIASFKPATQDAAPWQHCGKLMTSTLIATCNLCKKQFSSPRCSNCGTYQHTRCSTCRGTSTKPSKKQSMIEKFNSSSAYVSPTTPFTPRKNTESCEDYSEVFLSHARLYVLADTYDIKQLRDLSVHKLWVSLKEFVLYPERMGDIIGLVRYSFSNTIASDKLRTLLKDFCSCIVEDLSKGEDFQELIYEAPDFACELIKQMGDRLD